MIYYIVTYIVMWLWTWGTLCAEFQYMTEDPEFARSHYRLDVAASCGMALIPVFWILSPFVTGFYQHGWNLRSR